MRTGLHGALALIHINKTEGHTLTCVRKLHWAWLTTSKKVEKWVLVVSELFAFVVNDFDAKKFVCYNEALFVTELIVDGTQCRLNER